MAPAPVPEPFVQPFLTHAKSGWDSSENFMNWFTKIVTSVYSWSDLLIKLRQDKANRAYKIQRAETKAMEIMAEHQKKLKEKEGNSISVSKRDHLPSAERQYAKRAYLSAVDEGYEADAEESLADFLDELLELEIA